MYRRMRKSYLREHDDCVHLLVKHHPPEVCYGVLHGILRHNKGLRQVVPLWKKQQGMDYEGALRLKRHDS